MSQQEFYCGYFGGEIECQWFKNGVESQSFGSNGVESQSSRVRQKKLGVQNMC